MNLSQWILLNTGSKQSVVMLEIFKNYAIVITTNSGLWRYWLDTVRFTSLSPPYSGDRKNKTPHQRIWKVNGRKYWLLQKPVK
jgi:hypothetical protein